VQIADQFTNNVATNGVLITMSLANGAFASGTTSSNSDVNGSATFSDLVVTNAGNNTSLVGFKKGVRADINITAFWWRQGPWMPLHELGHVLGFFHEHQRWDRDQCVTIHYENIRPGRAGDYDWIAKTNWLVSTLPYDYRSIMHYRICWASKCESECKDGVGSSPCAVIEPLDKKYDGVIGQWTKNSISAFDAEKLRLIYGVR